MVLLEGCVFATENPQMLGKVIDGYQTMQSLDKDSKYGHTGIIQDPKGLTYEAVWSITEQDFFEAYKGKDVLIAKWLPMNRDRFNQGMASVLKYKGRTYPAYRLIWHLLGIAKWLHILKTPVCSELTAMFLINAGAKLYCGQNCWGVTPDNMVDDWRINKEFEIIYEGKLYGRS